MSKFKGADEIHGLSMSTCFALWSCNSEHGYKVDLVSVHLDKRKAEDAEKKLGMWGGVIEESYAIRFNNKFLIIPKDEIEEIDEIDLHSYKKYKCITSLKYYGMTYNGDMVNIVYLLKLKSDIKIAYKLGDVEGEFPLNNFKTYYQVSDGNLFRIDFSELERAFSKLEK